MLLKSTYKISLALILASIVSSASYAAENTDKKVTDLLKFRLQGVPVTDAVETPIKGMYQTTFGERYGYLLEGGRYVIIGDLIDLKSGKNYTAVARRDNTVKLLAQFDDSDMIIYPAVGETKEVLTVFTDTSCPYCKKLHRESQQLIDAGIQVQYLPFPRGSKGGPGYQTLREVWCAKDRLFAMHVAKETESGDFSNDGKCEQGDIVDKGFEVGNAIGVTGTPAMFTSTGKKIDGYVPYARLIPMLLNK